MLRTILCYYLMLNHRSSVVHDITRVANSHQVCSSMSSVNNMCIMIVAFPFGVSCKNANLFYHNCKSVRCRAKKQLVCMDIIDGCSGASLETNTITTIINILSTAETAYYHMISANINSNTVWRAGPIMIDYKGS